FLQAVFVSMGQRVAFRWGVDPSLRMPADRFSLLASPRPRTPTCGVLRAALLEVVEPREGAGPIAVLAPMLPAGTEVTVIGQRVGVQITQHESLLCSFAETPFDRL